MDWHSIGEVAIYRKGKGRLSPSAAAIDCGMRTCGARASGARLRLEPASMPSRRGYFLLLRQKKVTKEKALWWVDAARLDYVRI